MNVALRPVHTTDIHSGGTVVAASPILNTYPSQSAKCLDVNTSLCHSVKLCVCLFVCSCTHVCGL